ncbi:hypothetical protein ACFY5C_18815 [Streptomyces sp. NPDC012935]|uniref:hypothetical protein n=1 Tax=Streptomyces sp. NPDC012935 TaxID=3364857 RepID=UPI0036CB40F7
MEVRIADSVRAQIVDGALAYTPRFILSGPFVAVGAYKDIQEKEGELVSTFGSAQWLWSEDDDLRFRMADHELQSLCLYLPQATAASDFDVSGWERARRITGGLRTVANANFSSPQTNSCWVAPDATHLICLRNSAPHPDASSFRLSVAPDLDLLFVQGQLVGWLLGDPARYLTAGWEMPGSEAPAETTRSLLARTLVMTMSPEAEAIEDGDPVAWRRLRGLAEQLRAVRGDRRRTEILQATVDRFVEWHES